MLVANFHINTDTSLIIHRCQLPLDVLARLPEEWYPRVRDISSGSFVPFTLDLLIDQW